MTDHDRPPPFILDPQDQSTGRPASFIFLHGYGDDAEGLPQGLAQQFQFYKKLPHLRWVLPNAPFNRETMNRAWYLPKALPNSLKPRVPGEADESKLAEAAEQDDADDEQGILASCKIVDELVLAEIDRGVEPGRIVVGGFSQGCAVSLVWGLTGQQRKNVCGVCCLSGYFPLASRIAALREEGVIAKGDKGNGLQWFYIHGNKDVLVPTRLFTQGKEELCKWIEEQNLEEHLYDGMGHSTNNKLLRDLLGFLSRVVPP
jgi:predicted esterase